MIYRRWLKRLVDAQAASVLLVAVSPALIAGAVAVKLTSRGPILFKQERAGHGGEPFVLWKLRTMRVDPKREVGQTRGGDPDVLPVGVVLRRLKIDELPQLINVLKGDMSLVGPRPCLLVTAEEMPDWARRRFDARPGLTGLAQVRGNIALSWEERWRYDVQYVESLDALLDLKILARTVAVVVLGEERFRRAP